MRRVRLRKDVVFRLYLAAFCAVFLCSILFLISMQSRFHQKEIVSLRSQLSALSAEMVEIKSVSSVQSVVRDVPSNGVEETPLQRKFRRFDEDLFWIEGHGYNGKYAYLDLEFKDGYRARYYFRPFPKRSELISLHRRIEHDALSHYRLPDDGTWNAFDGA